MLALITRPVEDAEPLAALLAARGVVAVREPLLAIRPAAGAAPDLDGVQAVLFTSANGARAFAAAAARRDLPVLDAAGSVVAGDLAARLAAGGFRVRRAVLYAADPVAALSPGTTATLRERRIAAAFFFSPRTAAHFVTLARAVRLDETCDVVTAFSLSPAVARELAPIAWARSVVAATPDQAAMLTAFDDFLAGRRAAAGTAKG